MAATVGCVRAAPYLTVLMENSDMRLSGKRVIVTGAGGGIGNAIANKMSAEGACVMLCDLAGKPVPTMHPGQIYREMDVASPDDWSAAVNDALGHWAGVDVLVNNAAMISYQAIHEVDLESWNRCIAVNQTGPMLGMRAVIPLMKKQGGGSIINITSSWALVAVSGVAAYHATKGALRMMTKNAAITYAPDKIRVNSIVPGIVRTPMTDKQPEVTAAVIAQSPLGLTQPEEIATGAVFLASDEASAVTGSDMVMDGGYTVQ